MRKTDMSEILRYVENDAPNEPVVHILQYLEYR